MPLHQAHGRQHLGVLQALLGQFVHHAAANSLRVQPHTGRQRFLQSDLSVAGLRGVGLPRPCRVDALVGRRYARIGCQLDRKARALGARAFAHDLACDRRAAVCVQKGKRSWSVKSTCSGVMAM